ncbi:MAG: hypothetical protein SLAVMIC_00859 [uncultured marine phage]|uniref:Uncharacterized protein n=1 Tax=uncultured marine phage TaxID=707152 RepID=A0A8D9CAR8_9VIRU|nr:MAG: hypothetical protein SLAVMIC_00859 [uncultured marine phage]
MIVLLNVQYKSGKKEVKILSYDTTIDPQDYDQIKIIGYHVVSSSGRVGGGLIKTSIVIDTERSINMTKEYCEEFMILYREDRLKKLVN